MKKLNIVISIIIPCYNAEKYLDDTINSILKQHFDITKIEIILINDGSTDNTINVCKKYENQYIKVIDKINTGVSDSRNKGIESASGKYILFLDSDDYLQNNSIKNIVNFFDDNYDNIDLVTYPLKMFTKKGKFNTHFRYNKYFNRGTGVYDLNTFYNNIQSTINVCIKNNKKVFFNVNQLYSEDELFVTEILMDKKKIGFVKEAGYCYRRHVNSITAHKSNRDFEIIYKYYNYLLEKYSNHPYIQTIVLNNFRWRIEENCLYPHNIKEKNLKNYNNSFIKRIEKIDISILMEADYLTLEQKIMILTLGNKKIDLVVKNSEYAIYCDNKFICFLREINISIEQIKLSQNVLNIDFSILSYIFESFESNIKIKFEYYENEAIWQNELKDSAQNEFHLKKNFQFNINIDKLKKISFFLDIDNKETSLMVVCDKFCSYSKNYLNYNILINNQIFIKKANIFTKMRNKFFYYKNLKVKLISFLSLFYFPFRKIYLYIENTDKDNFMYEKYINDSTLNENIKRIYFKNGIGLKYKLCILKAKKIYIYNFKTKFLHFGKANKDYIQASNFEVNTIY